MEPLDIWTFGKVCQKRMGNDYWDIRYYLTDCYFLIIARCHIATINNLAENNEKLSDRKSCFQFNLGMAQKLLLLQPMESRFSPWFDSRLLSVNPVRLDPPNRVFVFFPLDWYWYKLFIILVCYIIEGQWTPQFLLSKDLSNIVQGFSLLYENCPSISCLPLSII